MDKIEFERTYGDVLPKRFWYGYIALQQAEDIEDVFNAHNELMDCAYCLLNDERINSCDYYEIRKYIHSKYCEKLHQFFK